MKTLLVEGWRGINHSIALVNQHQLLALGALDGLRLFHRDLPFVFEHWSRAANAPGMPDALTARIDAIPEPPPHAAIDGLYRIAQPIGDAPDTVRTATFIVTELGLSAESHAPGLMRKASLTDGDNIIVTCSRWARDRIAEDGFNADRIRIIPHGVDAGAFLPLSPGERRMGREALGLREDETVFLNIGVPTWNKGLDLLVQAFAMLRSEGRRVRLLVKDQRGLYNLPIDKTVQALAAQTPHWFGEQTTDAITVIPGNLTQAQVRSLYGLADCYVSPYRAEGFNLPVIEAIACGMPVIATAGGATDDFCTDAVAIRIPGLLQRAGDAAAGQGRTFIEPDADALAEAMRAVARGDTLLPEREAGRAMLIERFSWAAVARDLARLTVGLGAPDVATPTPYRMPDHAAA